MPHNPEDRRTANYPHTARKRPAGQPPHRNVSGKNGQALANALIRADNRESFRATVLA